jgi:hypothetical protein
LHRNHSPLADCLHQGMVKLVHRAVVIAADRRHGDKLSLDEFDSVAVPQDADLAHAVILAYRDGPAGDPWMGGQESRFVEHGRLLAIGAWQNRPCDSAGIGTAPER